MTPGWAIRARSLLGPGGARQGAGRDGVEQMRGAQVERERHGVAWTQRDLEADPGEDLVVRPVPSLRRSVSTTSRPWIAPPRRAESWSPRPSTTACASCPTAYDCMRELPDGAVQIYLRDPAGI
jgi:hypothetical protein